MGDDQLERIRQHLVSIGVEPAQDPNCDVADTTIKAIDAMIAAFKQTSDLLNQLYGGGTKVDRVPSPEEWAERRGRK
ncbi:hypothetical protein SEA_ELINAL_74 [Gordonia phage Elinal]|nr:hypothetical protein SEA_ELINAL_74 [Gordonia phage Elinal]